LDQKLLAWAEHYIRHGFSLIPLPPGEKAPRMKQWPERASNDIHKVTEWIAKGYRVDPEKPQTFSTGGLGIVCGRKSGVIVLDVDGEEGKRTLHVLMGKYGILPKTPTQKTPGGGYHLFFRYWGPCGNRAGMLDKAGYKGLDVRGDGGQVVAAPSLHPNGKPYEWAPKRDLEDLEIAECPEWLRSLIEGKGLQGKGFENKEFENKGFENKGIEGKNIEGNRIEDRIEDRIEEKEEKRIPVPEPVAPTSPQGGTPQGGIPREGIIPEGQRDDTLTRLAGSMRRWGMPAAAIEAALLETNKSLCRPPLDDGQVRKIAWSIGRKAPGYLPGLKNDSDIDISKIFTNLEADTTPIEYIGGIFPRGDISLFFGKEGHGKTIWLDAFTRDLSMGGTIMGGVLGKDEPARKVIFFEGDTDVKLFEKRMHEYRFGGDKSRLKYVFSRKLQKDEETKDLVIDIGTDRGFEIIQKVMAQEAPDMVIFDTLQSFHFLDEGKMDQMQMLFSRLLTLATIFDCAVVVVHHARKGNPKFRFERLTRDDAQGSNIFLRKSWTVLSIEKINTGNRAIHVFSRMKDWGRPEQDDWFGFQIAEAGLYEKYLTLQYEFMPDTGQNKSSEIKQVILKRVGWFTRKDIIDALPGCSEQYIKKILREMLEANILEKEGKNRDTRYHVYKNDQS
jgi:hypothetical protein